MHVLITTTKSSRGKRFTYMRSSATVLRWNFDLSSLGTDESTSFPLVNSMLPIWRIAATTLKIASCWFIQRVTNQNKYKTASEDHLVSYTNLPVPFRSSRQYPLLFLSQYNHEHHLYQQVRSISTGSDNETSSGDPTCTFRSPASSFMLCPEFSMIFRNNKE